MRRAALAGFAGLALVTGCATITEGTSEVMAFRLQPKEAVCVLSRDGDGKLGSVGAGTTTVRVSKDKDDIVIECEAPGYQAATTRVASHATKAGLAGTLIDFGITDMLTGAMYAYPTEVSIVLKPF